ncbi:MAG TPA: hypothetical protein PKI62_16340 [bacterium]|nr:hypothetical protein [bacterium]HPR87680.1 hypothetical protein [bacterium]
MKVLVLICNVISLAFTLFVLATDGAPTKPVYIFFGLCLILVPLFTIFTLTRTRILPARGALVSGLAAAGNILLLAFVCWALIDQYPHPNEPGFIPYAVLILLTPALSALVLIRHRSAKPLQA